MAHMSVEAGKYKSARWAGKAGDPGEPMLGMKSKSSLLGSFLLWGVSIFLLYSGLQLIR